MAKDTYLELGVQANFKEIDETGSRGCSWLAVLGRIGSSLGITRIWPLLGGEINGAFWCFFGDIWRTKPFRSFTFLNEKS
jgi:hypothetical protein